MALAICSLTFCLLAIEAVARTFRLLPPPSQNFRFSPTKGYELAPRHKEWLKSHFALYAFVKPRMSLLLNRLSTAELDEAIGNGAALPPRNPLRLAAKGQITAVWDLCRQSLQEIAATLRARDTPVVLVIFPLLVDLTDTSYPFKVEHALVAKTGSESQRVVLDLLPEFLGLEPSSLWAKLTDSHPNARAHAIAVEALYRTLLTHSFIPHVAPLQKQTDG